MLAVPWGFLSPGLWARICTRAEGPPTDPAGFSRGPHKPTSRPRFLTTQSSCRLDRAQTGPWSWGQPWAGR